MHRMTMAAPLGLRNALSFALIRTVISLVTVMSGPLAHANPASEPLTVDNITANRIASSPSDARTLVLNDIRRIAIATAWRHHTGTRRLPPLKPTDLDAAILWLSVDEESMTADSYTATASAAVNARWLSRRSGRPPSEPFQETSLPHVAPEITRLSASIPLSSPNDRPTMIAAFAAIPGLHVEQISASPTLWIVLLTYTGTEHDLIEQLQAAGAVTAP
jgi:hypothetical protein